jgi:hypothetical protein
MGNPTIPASVGYSKCSIFYNGPDHQYFSDSLFFSSGPHSFYSAFGQNRANIIVKGQKSGNTTLAFVIHNRDTWPSGAIIIVWTYNSAGALIAASQFGPYLDTILGDIRFADNGKLIVWWRWFQNGGGPYAAGFYDGSEADAAWTLNEFGAVEATAGPYGPYTGWYLGKVDLGPDNAQSWFWGGPSGSLITWTFTPGGQLATALQDNK